MSVPANLQTLSDGVLQEELATLKQEHESLYWSQLTAKVRQEPVPPEEEGRLSEVLDGIVAINEEMTRRCPPAARKTQPLRQRVKGSLPRRPPQVRPEHIGHWLTVGWADKPATTGILVRIIPFSTLLWIVSVEKGARPRLDIVRRDQVRGFSNGHSAMYSPSVLK